MPISITSKVTEYFRMTPVQKIALDRLGIRTIEDLLRHFPVRYGDTAEAKNIESLQHGDNVVIFGKISGLKTGKGFKSHIAMAEGDIEDETGRVHAVWFNQPYVAKMFVDGTMVRIEGKVSERRKDNQLYFSNPKIETVNRLPTGVGNSLFGSDIEAHTLYPVYPESRGISSSWIYHAILKIFKSGILDTIPEPIPPDILEKYHLPGIKTALIWVHTPQNQDDTLSARKRFAFEEIFTIQLGKQRARKEYREHPTYMIETDPDHVREFVRRFPFTSTEAQNRCIETILSDLKRDFAMSRLLEGDVGSGKTAVAAAIAYAVMVSKPVKQKDKDNPLKEIKSVRSANLQIAYMCPTEILATQHFESFIKFFSYMPIQIGLITGSGARKFPSKVNPKGWTDISRTQLLKWVANGEIAVLIGTHALIQKSVVFKNLACAIIDEQHRFGTNQRSRLIKKENQPVPHLLSMTATPIPRTLALTMYGDLDLSLLDQSPANRKPIITELVLPDKRQETYEKIREQLKAGRQMYVICPRIDEPDPDMEAAIIAKSVKEEAKRLKRSVFPEYEIGILHGKMSPKEKDRTMLEFASGKINILCATSVVEVGVNVENATVIIIEGAERFGLAQLHQLRGRVMRSSHQSFCYAFTETNSQKSIERLKALQTAKNGFELAELDLAQRGAGGLSGRKQWGISDIAMESLKNLRMVEAARNEAVRLIEEDSRLDKYPILNNKVKTHTKTAHFE
ncbi:MAG: ATP-dependent DNA helicase RecG [Candidatus Paceibacterota bacterium]|jgi:ATP-dependent DNA helicase RecG